MKTNLDYAHAKAEAIRNACRLTLSQLAAGSLTVEEAETVMLQVIATPTVLGMEAVSEVVADVASGKMTVLDALDWLL